MKKLIFTSVITLLLAAGSIVTAQNYPDEYLGLPGDNLNLYAVMDIFRESETLEGFERNLNDPEKVINNLDLNGDNYVDYIYVRDYVDGNVHTIVMNVALNEREYQDVAVFTVEKLRDGSVVIQLIGDEALYGKNYIIEPNYAETPNPGYRGNAVRANNPNVVTTTYYHVAAWPVVSYIYMPGYVVWYSPYYYGYYPVYWRRWRPYYWHYYYGYHYHWHGHYYSYYRSYPHYRYPGYHDYYYRTKRNYSTQVGLRIREGYYRTTYSRPDEMSRGENHYHKVASSRSPGNNNATGRNNSGNAGRIDNPANNAGNRVNAPRTGSSANSNSFRTEDRSGDVRKGNENVNARPQNTRPDIREGERNNASRPTNAPVEVKREKNTGSDKAERKVNKTPSSRNSSATQAKPSKNTSGKSDVKRSSNSRSNTYKSSGNSSSVSSNKSGSRGSVGKTPSRSSSSSASGSSSSGRGSGKTTGGRR